MSNKRQLKFIFEDYELKLQIIMSFEEKIIFEVQKYPVLYRKSAAEDITNKKQTSVKVTLTQQNYFSLAAFCLCILR